MTPHFGFVYIWFDKRRRRFYVGSHYGNINDGYICSSNGMRDAHRRRPTDFKRRIIFVLTEDNFGLLRQKEQEWLNLIPGEELGRKYYNKSKKANGHFSPQEAKAHWADPETKERHKAGMRKAWTPERRAAHATKLKTKWENPEGKFNNRKERRQYTPEEAAVIYKTRGEQAAARWHDQPKRLQMTTGMRKPKSVPSWNKGPTLQLVCAQCGTSFEKQKRKDRDPKYCSLKCWNDQQMAK